MVRISVASTFHSLMPQGLEVGKIHALNILLQTPGFSDVSDTACAHFNAHNGSDMATR